MTLKPIPPNLPDTIDNFTTRMKSYTSLVNELTEVYERLIKLLLEHVDNHKLTEIRLRTEIAYLTDTITSLRNDNEQLRNNRKET